MNGTPPTFRGGSNRTSFTRPAYKRRDDLNQAGQALEAIGAEQLPRAAFRQKDELTHIRRIIAEWRTAGTVMGPKPDGQLALIFDVILGTGARIGEALAIPACDVDFSAPPSRSLERSFPIEIPDLSGKTIPNTRKIGGRSPFRPSSWPH